MYLVIFSSVQSCKKYPLLFEIVCGNIFSLVHNLLNVYYTDCSRHDNDQTPKKDFYIIITKIYEYTMLHVKGN